MDAAAVRQARGSTRASEWVARLLRSPTAVINARRSCWSSMAACSASPCGGHARRRSALIDRGFLIGVIQLPPGFERIEAARMHPKIVSHPADRDGGLAGPDGLIFSPASSNTVSPAPRTWGATPRCASPVAELASAIAGAVAGAAGCAQVFLPVAGSSVPGPGNGSGAFAAR